MNGLGGRTLSLSPDVRSGTPGAVLGYPENGPFTITPARVGDTGPVVTQDSYGRGPITRELTALRGEVHSGNSGGPIVEADGKVMGTANVKVAVRLRREASMNLRVSLFRDVGGYDVADEIRGRLLGRRSGVLAGKSLMCYGTEASKGAARCPMR